MTSAFDDQPPAEDIARGTVFAAAAIPAGVIVWVVLWQFGFIASIVGFGVAYLAMFLYRFGAGVVGRQGAIRVTVVTVLTLVLAFFGGVVSDVLGVWTADTGESAVSALVSPDFWNGFQVIMGLDGVLASYVPDFALAMLFGLLGCFSVLRSAFRSTAAAPSASPYDQAPLFPPADPPAAPPAPPAAPEADTTKQP